MPTIAANPAVRRRQLNTPTRRRQASHPAHRRRSSDAPAAEETLVSRTLGWVAAKRPEGLLDNFVRRGLWFPFFVLALLGIVGLQLLTLGATAGSGRTADGATVLERQNTALAAEVSRLESSDRLDHAVAGMGLVDPTPGSTRYLRANGQVIADTSAPQATPTELAQQAQPQTASTAAAAAPAAATPQAQTPQTQAPAAQQPAATQQPAAQTQAPAAQAQAPATQSVAPAAQQQTSTGGAGAPVAPAAAVSVP